MPGLRALTQNQGERYIMYWLYLLPGWLAESNVCWQQVRVGPQNVCVYYNCQLQLQIELPGEGQAGPSGLSLKYRYI